MAKGKSKVIRYRKPIRFNIGMIVFLVFFIYLAVNVFSYMTRGTTKIYEVGTTSSVVQDNTYTGLILRSETVHTAPEAGYINFYVREGSRAAVGATVYSVDTKGDYTKLLNSGTTGDSSLTSDQLGTLKTKLSAFAASYSPESFSGVYDLKYSLQNLLFGYIASSSLEDLEDLGIDTTYLQTVEADVSGVVEYYTDGYETMDEENLTMSDLDSGKYEKTVLSSGTLVETDTAVYKTITSESWYVYLPLTEDDRNQLAETTSVTLLFTDVNLELTADFSLLTTSDGSIIGRCALSRYMVQLADKRYTNVTLKKSAVSSLNITGLKIPKSAVITKEFYVVPVEYATNGGNDSELGFAKETYTADGTVVEFITPTIYASTEDYYYLDPADIEEGTVLRKPTGNEVYVTAAETTEASGETSTEETSDEETSTEETSTEETSTEETSTEETSSEETSTEETSSEKESSAEEITRSADSGSSITYTVGVTSSLSGVYCVNKGYAVFRQITVLDESSDYYIISEGQIYGLSVYDHILLDGSSYEEGQLIY